MSIPLTSRVKANNELGFRLLSHLAASENAAGENVLLSPVSIAIALAMTYNGADGEAKKALGAILEVDESILEELNEINAKFLSVLNGLDPRVTLAMANSIWVASGSTPAPQFVRQIADHYAGRVANLDSSNPVDAARAINEWVAKKTQGKIANLLSPEIVSEAIIILVNAIYFKGVWTNQFDKGHTTERAFTCANGKRKRIPMMAQSGSWYYSETESFRGIILPYGERRVGMHVLMPKPDVPLHTFQEHLTSERWKEWLSHSRLTTGNLMLPRFRASYKEDLLKALVVLGGKGLMGPAFPGMGVGELVIDAVIHEAVLEVNEEGAEAAAATAVSMSRGGPQHPFSMVVDGPFFCAICDHETGAILFMGWILEPE